MKKSRNSVTADRSRVKRPSACIVHRGEHRSANHTTPKARRSTPRAERGAVLPEDWREMSLGAHGQILRAAQRFALSGAAGELAIQLGILPWPPGVVASATEELFASWLGDRGNDTGEIRGACEQIRSLLERFGDSRFDPLTRTENTRPVSDRLGWVRGTGNDRQWLIAPETWRTIFCEGFDPTATARALADRGVLLAGADGKFSRTERIDGKSQRVYVVTAALLTNSTTETTNE